jgi:hypothetical protein
VTESALEYFCSTKVVGCAKRGTESALEYFCSMAGCSIEEIRVAGMLFF